MNRFEADAAQDDFEVEIIDLPTSEGESSIPAAIAALRTRVSLARRSEEPGGGGGEDDFEVEVTDLPANEGENGSAAVPAVLGALHSRLPRKAHFLRLATVGFAILLMLAIIFGNFPAARDTVFSLFVGPTPTPTPDSTIASTRFGRFRDFGSWVIIPQDSNSSISISSTPLARATVIPWSPTTNVSDVLGDVPQDCRSSNMPQDGDSQFTDFPYGNAVGGPPLWVIGFEGTSATLFGFTRASPAQYGWVHQITLVLQRDTAGPVMLQGARLSDEVPILFSDPYSGQSPSTFLTLSLDTSPASNAGINGPQWGTRTISLYIPAAGCYVLKASWEGGSWEVLFAAGE